MDGNGAVVTWIGDSDDRASLDWLETVSRTGGRDSIGELSLYAIALHRSDDATERLYRLAAKPGNDVAEQAVFWLGETRGQRGLEKLLLLLDQASIEKNTEQMEHIVFAISMLPDDLGTDTLLELARDGEQPRKVRRQALFWLAHSDNDRAVAALADLLTRQ
jgi:HEAT repeat protein